MILVSLEWLRGEAMAQGLALSEEDLKLIQAQVEKNKKALATIRPRETHGLEPPYQFAPGMDHPTCAGLRND